VQVAETTARDHVRKRRRELGLTVGEVFIPQVHAPASLRQPGAVGKADVVEDKVSSM
jgi:hypothetical protein